jgi:hypothetical protein
MKVFGRISIFGEHLINTLGVAMAIKAPFVLTSNYASVFNLKSNYDLEKDSVARIIYSDSNVTASANIKGYFPFGFGFSGSTVLSLIHLRTSNKLANLETRIKEIDSEIHGFKSSGFDTISIIKQHEGILIDGKWINSNIFNYEYSLVIFDKEFSKNYELIKSNILEQSKGFDKYIQSILQSILDYDELKYNLLLGYSNLLLSCNIYSSPAYSLIQYMLNNGVVAKGIGGIYDKAVLVIWKDVKQKNSFLNCIQSFNPKDVYFVNSKNRILKIQY